MGFRLHVPPQEAYRALDALVAGNLLQIRAAGAAGTFPVLQGLSEGTILYAPEEDIGSEDEEWWSWQDILDRGVADCEDIAAAVAAELLASGTLARPLILPLASGDYHVVVEYQAGGRTQRGDPTKLGHFAMIE